MSKMSVLFDFSLKARMSLVLLTRMLFPLFLESAAYRKDNVGIICV